MKKTAWTMLPKSALMLLCAGFFQELIEDRLSKYQALADQYGYTIKIDDLYQCHSADDVINLIAGIPRLTCH